MTKFSRSHSLFPPSIFTTRFIFLIAIQSCQYQPNYHLHPVHLRPKDTGSDVRRKTSHTSNVIKVKIQCGVHIKGPYNGKTNSVTHQTFETLGPPSWPVTKALTFYTRESKRIPGSQGLRWMVNSPAPSSRTHTYAVIPKKLTRILLSPRVRKDGKYPNMAIAFY